MDDASESNLARRRIPIDFLTQIPLVVLFAATRSMPSLLHTWCSSGF